MKKKVISIVAVLVLCLGLFTIPVFAAEDEPDPVSYVEYSVDTDNCKLIKTERSVTDCTVVEGSTEAVTWVGSSDEASGWYVVTDEVAIDSSVAVSGDVHLILTDGSSLTVSDGVSIAESSSLTIYGQTNGTGALIVTVSTDGKNGITGNVTVNGGNLTVTDSKGNEVEVIDNGDGTYSFTQPAGNVTITVTYVCGGEDGCISNTFSDLDTNMWYHEATDYAIKHSLMNGVGGGRFDPNGTASRAMIVTILWRLEGEPICGQGKSGTFVDVPEYEWYTEAVEWAASKEIVFGYNGNFNPNDPITREQLATILYRYAQYKGYDVSVGEDTNILSHEDALSISEYAIPAMQWACGSGLMQGDGVNLMPEADATRVQAAALFQRFCENAAEK